MTYISARIDFSDPHDSAAPRLRHAFSTPRAVMLARTVAEVRPVLDAVQAAALQGRWCVGYLRYEAAPAFDAALAVHDADGPLAWFAVYDEALPWPQPAQNAAAPPVQWQALLLRPVFDAALHTLQQGIARGEYYQVNFTAQMTGLLSDAASLDAAAGLFHALQRAQPGGYAAFLDTGDEQVLS
ncbi:MAG: bifunctional aminodeoxychorismate synthase component I/aminotransferase, partial [Polaromonas sp.]